MKKRMLISLLLVLGFAAFARYILEWTEDEMRNTSDLIVIGTVTKVRDLNETNTTLWPPWRFRGVETTFKVSKVVKGKISGHTVVLHHYSIRADNFMPANGPFFVDLTPNSTNRYLLYLVKDGTNRFAPVSGQLDPAVDAVRKLPEK